MTDHSATEDPGRLKGVVTFRAEIKGNGLSVPWLEFDPRDPGREG